MSILISVFALTHLLAALYLIAKLVEEIKNQRNPSRRSKRPRRARVNRSLETRLVSLLRNDIQAAHRLVGSARKHHPGRHENWYWEKAIADLERDRR